MRPYVSALYRGKLGGGWLSCASCVSLFRGSVRLGWLVAADIGAGWSLAFSSALGYASKLAAGVCKGEAKGTGRQKADAKLSEMDKT